MRASCPANTRERPGTTWYHNADSKKLNKYPVLRDIETRTKVPKAYSVLGLAASSVVLIFFNMFGLASPISNLIGWALPAYLSVQAIESPSTNDDKQWLTYWVRIHALPGFLSPAVTRTGVLLELCM